MRWTIGVRGDWEFTYNSVEEMAQDGYCCHEANDTLREAIEL